MSFSRFFGHDINFDLAMKPFTWQHYLLIFLGISVVVFTLRFAKTIKASKYEHLMKKVFIVWLIVLELSYHMHYWAFGMFSVPLHVCSFGVMFSILLLVTGKYRYFEILFFVGIFGGLLALFFPNTLGYTYYNMRYYHFIFLHMSIAMVPIYYYKAYGFRITYHSIYKTIGLFLCILPLVVFVNYTFDKNYMFIGEKPAILASILPDWPYYIFIFIGLVPILFHLLYFVSNFDYSKYRFRK
ncbi:MAG: TIGR02206 family membrane protein [Bacilli bacterium]|nr:TIGR02206 family membrane protein [Bacilli bacterium]